MFSLIRITTEHQGEARTLFPRATEKNVIFQKDLDGQNLLEFDATIFRRQFIEGTLMFQKSEFKKKNVIFVVRHIFVKFCCLLFLISTFYLVLLMLQDFF